MSKTIRIGNAQAFWGDRGDAAAELLSQAPDLDYLTMDYLAEVSMSILAIQRDRDPTAGYARDFLGVVRSLAPYWAQGGKCKLIVNAGGLNPRGCAEACARVLQEAGAPAMKIGIVSGDDVLAFLKGDPDSPSEFSNLDSGRPLKDVRDRLVTANAYIGSQGIVEALKLGAQLVITGRIADPSLVVAPCIHEFGWSLDRWDCIAGATVAGHLIECGTHVTGGISTDWLSVPDPTHIPFPIVEIASDGSCVVTKADPHAGRVHPDTVREQLIYEIGDPEKYLSPDVTVSFLQLKIAQDGTNRVRVSGAIGSPPPPGLKVSATYRDGYRAAGMLTIFGPDAVLKARRSGAIVLRRLQEAGYEFRDSIIECLGNGDSVPVVPQADVSHLAFESVLRVAVEADTKEPVERFSKEIMPLVTAGAQGTTGYAEGRPKVHSVFRYWPCLIDAKRVPYELDHLSSSAGTPSQCQGKWPPPARRPGHWDPHPWFSDGPKTLGPTETLADIAIGRSGDKGTGANVGILAKSESDYQFLKQHLTAERVEAYFASMGIESVDRVAFEAVLGFNFLIRGILRRGLRNDAQGKALAQALLAMPLAHLSPSRT